jgi:hypothetical protein
MFTIHMRAGGRGANVIHGRATFWREEVAGVCRNIHRVPESLARFLNLSKEKNLYQPAADSLRIVLASDALRFPPFAASIMDKRFCGNVTLETCLKVRPHHNDGDEISCYPAIVAFAFRGPWTHGQAGLTCYM